MSRYHWQYRKKEKRTLYLDSMYNVYHTRSNCAASHISRRHGEVRAVREDALPSGVPVCIQCAPKGGV